MKKPPPISLPAISSGTQIGGNKYLLRRRLAAGGNGVVWLAEHMSLGQQVVVKFPKRLVGFQSSQLYAEIQHLSNFSHKHPNIVNIIDAGQHGEQTFIVMQYLVNGALSEYLWKNPNEGKIKRSGLHKKGDWLLAVASALDFLHANQLYHCDIKPDNILFDSSFAPYISDFGIALDSFTAKSNTKNAEVNVYGSVPYMAPELFINGVPSAKSDLFSLAVTVWEFLAGQRPFSSNTADEFTIESKGVPLFSTFRSQTNPQLDTIFKRALSRCPQDRFATCQEFVELLIKFWPQEAHDQLSAFEPETKGWKKAKTDSQIPIPSTTNRKIQSPKPDDGDQTLQKSTSVDQLRQETKENPPSSIRKNKKINLKRLLPDDEESH